FLSYPHIALGGAFWHRLEYVQFLLGIDSPIHKAHYSKLIMNKFQAVPKRPTLKVGSKSEVFVLPSHCAWWGVLAPFGICSIPFRNRLSYASSESMNLFMNKFQAVPKRPTLKVGSKSEVYVLPSHCAWWGVLAPFGICSIPFRNRLSYA